MKCQHTGPGQFQCSRRFPGCGRRRPPRRRRTRGLLRRRVPVVLRGGCSKHQLSMLPKSPGQQTSGQAALLATSGSGRSHRQTLSERLAAHLQTLSERPAVSCPGVCRSICCAARLCHSVRPKQAHSELRWSEDEQGGIGGRRTSEVFVKTTKRVESDTELFANYGTKFRFAGGCVCHLCRPIEP